MKLYELKITILLKTDIELANANQTLAKAINFILTQNEYTRELHDKNGLKPYVFSLPYPIDIQTKIYQKDRVYLFSIRSIDEKFINIFKESLKKVNLDEFSILATELKEINKFFINSLYTLTSTISTITNEDKKSYFWTINNSNLEFIKEKIKNNLEKKYKQFFNQEIKAPDDFISNIILLNQTPFVTNHIKNKDNKKFKLFGNKFKIFINSDENSQKLAFLALGVGLLEKNSFGYGFVRGEK